MILTILQARMSSSRLPGKVLRPLLGQPMLARQIERLRRSAHIGRLVVATSTDSTDDVVEAWAEALGCLSHRGPLHDVLARYAGAVQAHGPAEHVVRVTADCPLTDPEVFDAVLELHLRSGADYTSNTVRRSFPKGLDVEAVRAPLLLQAAAESTDPYDREHVTPFFYRQPERFRVEQLVQEPDLSDLRWTVDTPDDYAFTKAVYAALHARDPQFGQAEVLALGWTRWTGEGPPPSGLPADSPSTKEQAS